MSSMFYYLSMFKSCLHPALCSRPRADEFSAEESEPKRALQPGASSSSSSSSAASRKPTGAQSPPGSEFDLFTRPMDTQSRAGGVSHPSQQGTLGRKRKELEEVGDKELEKEKADDLDMEELESLMSLEMEDFGEPSRAAPDQQAQLVGNRSVDKRNPASTVAVEHSSTSKRPRVDPQDPGGAGPGPSGGLLKGSTSTTTTTTTTQSLEAENCTNSIMRPNPLITADRAGGARWLCGGPEEAPAGTRSQEALAVKDENVSMVVVRPASAQLLNIESTHGPLCNQSPCFAPGWFRGIRWYSPWTTYGSAGKTTESIQTGQNSKGFLFLLVLFQMLLLTKKPRTTNNCNTYVETK